MGMKYRVKAGGSCTHMWIIFRGLIPLIKRYRENDRTGKRPKMQLKYFSSTYRRTRETRNNHAHVARIHARARAYRCTNPLVWRLGLYDISADCAVTKYARVMRWAPPASFAFLSCIFDKFRHAPRNRFSVRLADNSRIDLLIIRINFSKGFG